MLESFESIGTLLSYKEGAWNIIKHVPAIHAAESSHKKNLSNTIATYFQSSMTWKIVMQ